MGTYIRGMKMPTNCTGCACSNDETRYCKAANEYIPMIGKPRFCPLVEVTEPHGRLIDADALKMAIHETDFYYDSTEEKCKRHDIGRLVHALIDGIIDESPTVIEEEEG